MPKKNSGKAPAGGAPPSKKAKKSGNSQEHPLQLMLKYPGVRLDGIEVRFDDAEETGIFATEALRAGRQVLFIPQRRLLTADIAIASAVGQAIVRSGRYDTRKRRVPMLHQRPSARSICAKVPIIWAEWAHSFSQLMTPSRPGERTRANACVCLAGCSSRDRSHDSNRTMPSLWQMSKTLRWRSP